MFRSVSRSLVAAWVVASLLLGPLAVLGSPLAAENASAATCKSGLMPKPLEVVNRGGTPKQFTAWGWVYIANPQNYVGCAVRVCVAHGPSATNYFAGGCAVSIVAASERWYSSGAANYVCSGNTAGIEHWTYARWNTGSVKLFGPSVDLCP